MSKPTKRPNDPHFSSGPCKKFPGWSYDLLKDAALGRSHRHRIGFSKLEPAITRAHALLQMPEDYKLAIVPASSTGAMEMAMWNLLGTRGVDSLNFDVFGKRWSDGITKHLQIKDARIFETPFGDLPDLSQVDSDRDVVFTWNATTSGVSVPNGDWIKPDREGFTICDATSAAFAYDLPWDKLDAVGFSWQKVMGGEAAHGMLALSPRAMKHIETTLPPWPLPFLFQLREDGESPNVPGPIKEYVFRGGTLNTPSLMCTEDWLVALDWGEKQGGLPALIKKTDENAQIIWDWSDSCKWLDNLAEDPATRSKTSVCLKLNDPKLESLPREERWAFIKKLTRLLEDEGVAFDIKGHGWAKPCLRIWCGPTVEAQDLRDLIPWIEWAYGEVSA